MSKMKYRSHNVKSINRATLDELVRDKDIIFGHDVAKTNQYGVFMDKQDGRILMIISWKHPDQTLIVLDLLTSVPVASVVVVMESSGTYGDSFRYQLRCRDVPIYRVSAKHSSDGHELYDGVPSAHDAKSSAVIAELHRWNKSSLWRERSSEEKALRAAIKVMDLHQETYLRYLNKLEGLLARHWPELLNDLELTSATLLEFLGTYGSAQAAWSRSQEARILLRKVGGHFLKEEKIEAIIASSETTLGEPPTEDERVMLMEIARETRQCSKKATAAQRRVEKLTAEDESVQQMSSVVGTLTSAVLKAMVGDVRNYATAHAYEKSMGLNVKEKSSGKHKGKLSITKRGPGICRRYLFLAVLRMVRNDPVVRLWFEAKVKRDGGLKMKALIAVMRKLVRALWHVGRGAVFDSMLLFDLHHLLPSHRKVSYSPETI